MNIIHSTSGNDNSIGPTDPTYSVEKTEEILRSQLGEVVFFEVWRQDLSNIAGPDLPTDLRSRADMRAQNATNQLALMYARQTIDTPTVLANVPPELVEVIDSEPMDGVDVASVVTGAGIAVHR